MKLPPAILKKFKDHGLSIYQSDRIYRIAKPSNSAAEILSEGIKVIEDQTDYPILLFYADTDQWIVEVWDWTPGPGPGDFRRGFPDVSEAVQFTLDYFFTDNEYIRARHSYEMLSRNSFNLKEFRAIINYAIEFAEGIFGQNELLLQRPTFHKIPINKWRIVKFAGESPLIAAETGFIKNELFSLRTKLAEKKEFTWEDIQKTAHLLMELSVQLKEQEGK